MDEKRMFDEMNQNQDKNYNDLFSDTPEQMTAEIPDVTAKEAPVQPERNEYFAAPSKPIYSYESYRAQFEAPKASAKEPAGKKTEKKGRQTALIACSLILATCLGFGGGILGSALMSRNTATSVVAETKSETSDKDKQTGKTEKNQSSDLKVVEASKSEKGTNSVQSVVNKVKDSVVEITTESTTYASFYGQYVVQGAGSGVIITEDGYILTNNHVVEDSSQIKVTLTDGKSYDAKVIGTDDVIDIALLKIEAKNLTTATLGSSSDLDVGEMAVVIGNPLGKLGGSVTAGIISALNRNIKIDGQSMELLQTDAAINPGNSGGGLFDSEGNLVGIVVAKATQSGGTTVESIGYAIPIDNVKAILDDLKSKGYVSGRAVMGVTLVDVLSEKTARRYGVEQQGVYISVVERDGAADKAGLVVGDMIKKFDGIEVTKTEDVTNQLSKKKAGDQVEVVVYRDGEEKTITLTLQESVSENADKKHSNNFNADGGNNGSNNGGYYGYGSMDPFSDLYGDFFY